MGEVNQHTYLVHLLHHLPAERGQTFARILAMGRGMANIVVIGVAEGDVVHAHVLVFADVLDVLSDAITVLDADEKRFLSLGLQPPSIFLGQGDAADVLVLLHLGINGLNQFVAIVHRFLQGSIITLLLCKECREELCVELAFLHLLHAHLIVLAESHAVTSTEPKRRVGVCIDREDACVDVLRLLEHFRFLYQEFEELAHRGITCCREHLGMELRGDNRTDGKCFHHFGHTVVCPTGNLQPGSEFLDGLVVEGVHLDFILAEDLVHRTARHDGNAVRRLVARFGLTVVDVRRMLRGQILMKRTAHTYIDKLQASADTQHGHVPVGRQFK